MVIMFTNASTRRFLSIATTTDVVRRYSRSKLSQRERPLAPPRDREPLVGYFLQLCDQRVRNGRAIFHGAYSQRFHLPQLIAELPFRLALQSEGTQVHHSFVADLQLLKPQPLVHGKEIGQSLV